MGADPHVLEWAQWGTDPHFISTSRAWSPIFQTKVMPLRISNRFSSERPLDIAENLCSNFVKFGRREITETLRYLPDKKKQNFAWLSSCRHCADRAQNLPGPAPDNVLTVLQISSKLVHIRRSYSQTREHRQNAP